MKRRVSVGPKKRAPKKIPIRYRDLKTTALKSLYNNGVKRPTPLQIREEMRRISAFID